MGAAHYELLKGKDITLTADMPRVWQTLLQLLGDGRPIRQLDTVETRFASDWLHSQFMTQNAP